MLASLRALDLAKWYGSSTDDQPVFSDVNYAFKQGESYAITGVSGSGKSTLLGILGGLDAPSRGSVLFGEQNIFHFREKHKEHFLHASIGFVFQYHYLIAELTVCENVMLKGLIAGSSVAASTRKAKELLDYIGLADRADAYPHQLSGGQQQRVALARAIFNKPAFLLADEPTGSLDAHHASMLGDLLLACQQEWGLGLIIATHDPHIYERMQHVLELNDGRLVSLG